MICRSTVEQPYLSSDEAAQLGTTRMSHQQQLRSVAVLLQPGICATQIKHLGAQQPTAATDCKTPDCGCLLSRLLKRAHIHTKHTSNSSGCHKAYCRVQPCQEPTTCCPCTSRMCITQPMRPATLPCSVISGQLSCACKACQYLLHEGTGQSVVQHF